MHGLNDQITNIQQSFLHFLPELILTAGILLIIFIGLFKNVNEKIFGLLSIAIFVLSVILTIQDGFTESKVLFGMLQVEGFSSYLKILLDVSAILTCLMSISTAEKKHRTEYFALITAVVLGAHLLVMSNSMVMIFLSLELVSISSYILAGFSFDKAGSEGSLKYFLFGSIASAILLYGFTILYGITGTQDIPTQQFVQSLFAQSNPLILTASFMVLAGFLYKIAAAPMHPWAPDVYEASPMPVIAFFSAVPKLAGLGALTKFLIIMNTIGHVDYNWQVFIAGIAILTITVGNFSALFQKNVKRLMAYSSIAQTGFLLVGIVSFIIQGIQFMLFYASIFVLMNFLTFVCLHYFEERGLTAVNSFSGSGKKHLWTSVFLLVGLVALTGLPPTSGFTAKLLVFSSLWEAYALSNKSILLWLFIFGLLNTVVSLFYYLRIPYFAFLKPAETQEKQNFLTFQNLLAFILVVGVLMLFFMPGILMGLINKINFAF